MASEKQILANRRNARRSTGPTSTAGKQVVGRNALKHGVLSRHVLLPGENASALARLRRRILVHFQPATAFERVLVDRIVQGVWRLRRLGRVEAGLFVSSTCDVVAATARAEARRHTTEASDELWSGTAQTEMTITDEAAHRAALEKEKAAEAAKAGEVAMLGRAFLATEATFSALSRYESNIERGVYRALHELQRLQAARAGHVVPPPIAAEVDIALSVKREPAGDSAKQSQ